MQASELFYEHAAQFKGQLMSHHFSETEILQRIRTLDKDNISDSEIVRYLDHRSPEIRQEVIESLGETEGGESALLDHLGREKNELVLIAICDALGHLRSTRAVPALEDIAQSHPSWLVRSYAVEALLDILWEEAIPFLKQILESESSYRVRSKIHVALFLAGDDDFLEPMLQGLRFKDYLIRCSISNLLSAYLPDRHRATILKALQSALAREETIAARSSLVNAISQLSGE